MVKRKELFLFFSLLLLGVFLIYTYTHIKEAKSEIFLKIEKDKIQQLAHMFENLKTETILEQNIENSRDLIHFLSDKLAREKQEKRLALLLSSNLKYIYILVKDEQGRFRFLLDASRIDKANFYQKFDVDNPKYSKVYKTKEAQIIKQKDMENLQLTYLHPIVVNNQVIAILSVDITSNLENNILELIQPLETFFIILIIFIFLLISMTIIQVIHYFLTRKKIFTDPLTGLYNRNYLQEILPMLKLDHYSIAMLDLDRFKVINDTYGHKTGDFVLSQSSTIFKNSIRDSDILIRYGGEEFLLLIYNRDNLISTFDICERIRAKIESTSFHYDNHDINVNVSIGLHEKPNREKNINEAIKIADKMLYVAKNEGRNRVIKYSEKHQNNSQTKDINFVKLALQEDRVLCYYQPIYDYKTGSIYKYESLVRIVDVDGKIISPMEFLPELKHTNIHYKLTQRILSIVFKAFKDNSLSVSINLNFSDFINNDIENTILEELIKNKDLASRVTFEILESDEIDNIALLKEKVDTLRNLGAKISIDDFGSGYSNFRTVLDIEANYLKIDGSLIKNIDKNEKDFKVVKSIVNFAKEADMKTIAEFVHSKDVYNKLNTIDVDYLQGYYISPPSPKILKNEELF